MLNIFKTVDNNLFKLEKIEDDAWVSLVNPSEEEIDFVKEKLNIEMDFLRAALDVEEYSRIEVEEEHVLILIDMPTADKEDDHLVYSTLPFAIILTEKNIVTVCLKDSYIIDQFEKNSVRSFFTTKRYRFVLQILFKI